MKSKTTILLFGITAIVLMVSTIRISQLGKEEDMSTFVITETGKFLSLDPLEGDSSQNLPVARMLFATPIEIFADNTIGSYVLESFDYDREIKTIKWMVRSNAKYSDGTVITADDVAFAVSRMAYTRPNFPLIKLISGLSQWLKEEKPLATLPDGIKVDGQKIMIKLEDRQYKARIVKPLHLVLLG